MVRGTIANFEEMSNQSVASVTKNHDLWAHLLMSFTDIKQAVTAMSV